MRHHFFVLCSLFAILSSLVLGACAGKDKGDMPAFLQGTWISRDVGSEGDKTRLTFSGDNQAQLDAFKNTPTKVLSANIDSGSYRATTSSIDFKFNRLGDINSTLNVVSDFEIVVDGTDFLRANDDGTIAGGTISGQIHISDGTDQSAAQQSAQVSSASVNGLSALQVEDSTASTYSFDNSTRGVLLVQNADGTYRKVIVPADSSLSQNTEAGGTLTQKMSALSVQDADQAARTDDLQRQLEAQGEKVFRSGRMKLQSILVPSDPDYWRQWDMRSINAPGGWAILDNVGGVHNTKIAVVDTGKSHNDDLDGIWASGGYDFIAECGFWGTAQQDGCYAGEFPGGDGDARDSDPTDEGDQTYGPGQSSWHGTHVAGIMAAHRDNAEGVAGVNPDARIVPVRTIGYEGWGDIPDIAEGIRYAAGLINADGSPGNGTPRAKVINLSLGCFVIDPATYTGPDPSVYSGTPICGTVDATDVDNPDYLLNQAIQDAIQNGVVVVAAAGNFNEHQSLCNQAFYPADYPGVITVGGIDSNGTFATSVSAYGPHQSVVAPSGGLEPSNYLGEEPQVFNTVFDDFQGRVGTSQAAAFVSGLASAILSLNPNLTPAQVKNYIETTALDMGPAGWDDHYGYGLINVGAALEAVANDQFMDLLVAPQADFLVSADRLNFGQVRTEKVVYVHRVGTGTINNIQASADAPWLDVKLSSTTAPAYVTVDVNRDQLPDGDSEGTVTISTNTGKPKKIDVLVSQGVAGSSGSGSGGTTTGSGSGSGDSFDAWMRDITGLLGGPGFQNTADVGQLYVLLIDAGTHKVASALTTDFSSNYNFEFVALPAGNYYVMAGQPNDNGQICDMNNSPQLPCTAYPNYQTPELFVIEGNKVINDVTLGL